MKGTVYLIGAGPGDPGLITVRGRHCIQTADVIVYDYLASPQLLKHARADAEFIYVGKKGGDHTLPQEGINALLVETASAGKSVARLKGGDPFIFGRGGEEAEVLVANDIPFEIVPGVTSAIAAPAYAGIPLTHRKFTATLAFVTGHEDPTKSTSNIDWEALTRAAGTLVFFMGVKNLPLIVEELTRHGRAPDTPVALVRWGTTSRQRTVCGTLSTIVQQVRDAGLKAPAIIVVGEVVSLRDTMRWFDQRPLFGKRIVVTRAREQASALVERLEALGAECLEIPTIQIVPPEDWAPLDTALAELEAYQWVVFTSVNGVKYFFQRLFEKGGDVRRLRNARIAVIGPATRDTLLEYGIRADILPDSYRAESVVAAFHSEVMAGSRVLLPRAMEARSVLPEELAKMGARVDDVCTYRTRLAPDGADTLRDALEKAEVDMVTFTSSSTAVNFKALLPEDKMADLMKPVTVASIGPITTETAQSLGFTVALTAEDYTIPGLCDAILKYYQEKR